MFANWYAELNFFCWATFTPVSAHKNILVGKIDVLHKQNCSQKPEKYVLNNFNVVVRREKSELPVGWTQFNANIHRKR